MNTCPTCGTPYPPHVRLCPRDGSVLEGESAAGQGQIGQTLDGKYRLDALLGGGGMGAVYRATHVLLGKPVAVKLIKPELVTSPEIVRRFQREARAATNLNHPNIVGVHDLGQAEDGTLYIVMELVAGPSLKEVIRKSGALAPPRVVHILRQVASALSLAHKNSIIHRDLKPQNIMVTQDSEGKEVAKLLDFGIAKTLEEGATQLTMTGFALGTPQYMSPEQAMGKEIDARSDLYSLGVILYEMLIGEVPFTDQSTSAVILKHMSEPPMPLSQRRPDLIIPASLEAMTMRCLEKDPARRLQTADEVAHALDSAVGAQPLALAPDMLTIPLPAPMPAAQPTVVAAQTPIVPGAAPTATRQTATPRAAAETRGHAAESAHAATGGPAGTRPTVKVAPQPPAPEGAPATPGTAVAGPRRSAIGPLVLVAVLAAIVALAGVAFVVMRAGLFRPPPQQASPVEETATPPAAPVTSPAAAAQGPEAVQPETATQSPGAGATTSTAAGPTEPKVPTRAREPLVRGGVAQRSQASPPDAATGAPAPGEVRAGPTPPPARSLPENPPVFFRCGGAPEICSALRTAVAQALDRVGLPLTRSAERADVVLDANVEVLEERAEQQFGTTFLVRTYSIDVAGEAPHLDEAVPMPAPRTLSFDPRFGRDRAAEHARLVADAAVEHILAFWKKKR